MDLKEEEEGNSSANLDVETPEHGEPASMAQFCARVGGAATQLPPSPISKGSEEEVPSPSSYPTGKSRSTLLCVSL